MTGRTFTQINTAYGHTKSVGVWEPVVRWEYFWIIFAWTVKPSNSLKDTREHYKVLAELSGLWDATMTVLFYRLSLRTFTSDWLRVSVLGYTEFFLAPKRKFGPDSHSALLWRARKGLRRGQFLAWHGASWLGTAWIGISINTEF